MDNSVQREKQEGESAFIIQLYHNYSRLMYFTAKKYFDDDPQECEDVVQESILKLVKRTELLKSLDQARLTSYVVTTVKNTAITAGIRRKQKVQSTISISDLSEDLVKDSTSVIDITIARESKAELLHAIQQLKPEDRILLEGKYYLGYDDRELAKAFATTPANIRMRLTRVRRKLFRLMQETEVMER